MANPGNTDVDSVMSESSDFDDDYFLPRKRTALEPNKSDSPLKEGSNALKAIRLHRQILITEQDELTAEAVKAQLRESEEEKAREKEKAISEAKAAATKSNLIQLSSKEIIEKSGKIKDLDSSLEKEQQDKEGKKLARHFNQKNITNAVDMGAKNIGILGFVVGIVMDAVDTLIKTVNLNAPTANPALVGRFGAIGGPLSLLAIGVVTAIDLGVTIYKMAKGEKVAQGKTNIGFGLLTLAITVVALVVAFGAIVAPPFTLGSIFLGMVVVGAVRTEAIIHQNEQNIQAKTQEIADKEQAILTATRGLDAKEAAKDPTVQRLARERLRLVHEKQTLVLTVKQLKSTRKITGASITGIIGLVVAMAVTFAFPPLGGAMLVLAAVAGIALVGINLYAAYKTRQQQKQMGALARRQKEEEAELLSNDNKNKNIVSLIKVLRKHGKEKEPASRTASAPSASASSGRHSPSASFSRSAAGAGAAAAEAKTDAPPTSAVVASTSQSNNSADTGAKAPDSAASAPASSSSLSSTTAAMAAIAAAAPTGALVGDATVSVPPTDSADEPVGAAAPSAVRSTTPPPDVSVAGAPISDSLPLDPVDSLPAAPAPGAAAPATAGAISGKGTLFGKRPSFDNTHPATAAQANAPMPLPTDPNDGPAAANPNGVVPDASQAVRQGPSYSALG